MTDGRGQRSENKGQKAKFRQFNLFPFAFCREPCVVLNYLKLNNKPNKLNTLNKPNQLNKTMAKENDLILIYFEDQPLSFARIEEILPDSKPDWYHVKLLLLQIPPQLVTWILRDVYIDGDEFTMNGKRMRFEKVTVAEEPREHEKTEKNGENEDAETKTGNAKVISLSDLKKS